MSEPLASTPSQPLAVHAAAAGLPELSVVVPVCNEAGNVAPLAREVAATLAGRAFELVFVDDGSTDGTADAVRAARREVPQVRLIRHARRSGQSAAVLSGVRAARADWVATLDGDGQNDPADIPALAAARDAARRSDPAVRLVMGHRTTRRDSWLKRVSSRVANGVRGRLLGDGTPDTGCGIKLMHRPTFLELPFFDHQHRFLPALYQQHGARVISVPVNHRPRTRGTSKYGLHNRLWVGIVDLFGVMWLRARSRPGLAATEE
jgi:dolichol-phosphate mannosyltransferase